MKVALDYPSQQRGAMGPPIPVLLDTCVVQHLGYVMDFGDEWMSRGVRAITTRFSAGLATELLALGDIVQTWQNGDGSPWAVSRISRIEFEQAPAERQERPLETWLGMAQYWSELTSYVPEMADTIGVLAVSQETVHSEQLRFDLSPVTEVPFSAPSFGPFRDEGDRALILEAQRFGFPTILTTDLRSFWRHRSWLYPYGIELWRPSDVLRSWGFRVPAPV